MNENDEGLLPTKSYHKEASEFMKQMLPDNFVDLFIEYCDYQQYNKNELRAFSLECGQIVEQKCFLSDIARKKKLEEAKIFKTV